MKLGKHQLLLPRPVRSRRQSRGARGPGWLVSEPLLRLQRLLRWDILSQRGLATLWLLGSFHNATNRSTSSEQITLLLKTRGFAVPAIMIGCRQHRSPQVCIQMICGDTNLGFVVGHNIQYGS